MNSCFILVHVKSVCKILTSLFSMSYLVVFLSSLGDISHVQERMSVLFVMITGPHAGGGFTAPPHNFGAKKFVCINPSGLFQF